jgi:hypothetical protein
MFWWPDVEILYICLFLKCSCWLQCHGFQMTNMHQNPQHWDSHPYPLILCVKLPKLFVFFFCAVLLCVFMFWVPCCDVHYDFHNKALMLGSSLPPVVCWRAHFLVTLFVVVCALWCTTHIMLCFCCLFLRLVYPCCQFFWIVLFIAPLVLSNVYLI